MPLHSKIFRFWQDRTLRAHFLINVLVGVVIAVIFAVTAGSRWGEGLLNTAFDLLVQHEYAAVADPSPELSRLFFVEITSDEYRRSGEPLITPRRRVAQLIETAWRAGAPVIAVDILLDRPDHADPSGDRILIALLERMLKENARTQVILPIRIGSDGLIRPHLCDLLFDRTTTDGRKLLHRAVPTVLASEDDLLNRFWGLYQVGQDSRDTDRIIWSLPLVAAAIQQGQIEQLDRLAGELLHVAPGGYHALSLKLGGGVVEVPTPITEQGKTLAGEAHGLPYTQRIRFLIPPDTKARRDADKFRPDLALPSLTNKIVVIGNGSPETGDILATPVGSMPGMYVIGNAINTIISGQMPVHMNVWLHYGIELLVIVFAAWLFLHFHSFLAQNIATIVFIILLVPLSWLLFKQWGVFFNFIVPIIGMRLHKIADSIETMIASRGRKQHHHH